MPGLNGDGKGWKAIAAAAATVIAVAGGGYVGGDALADRIAKNDTKIAVLETRLQVAEARTEQIKKVERAVNELATQQRLLLQGIERDRRERERERSERREREGR